MAKDAPGTQTVPVFGADGQVLGFTTPEKANQIAGDVIWAPALSGQLPLGPNNPNDMRDVRYAGDGLVHYGPDKGGITLPAGSTLQGSMEIARQQQGDPQLSLGNPPGMGIPGDTIDNRPGGGGYMPPEDVPPGGDPFTPPGGGSYEQRPEVDWGGRADLSGVPGFETLPDGGYAPFGYEGSSNQDFYAQQFANARTQDFRNQLREEVARERQAEINRFRGRRLDEQAEKGAWQWAGGRKQFAPTLGTGERIPVSYDFNPEYADMGLGDIYSQVKSLPVFNRSASSKSQEEVLNNLFSNDARTALLRGFNPGDYASPTEAFAAINPDVWKGMNRAGVAQEGLQNILNQVYTASEMGPFAPVGYAVPVNWSGGTSNGG